MITYDKKIRKKLEEMNGYLTELESLLPENKNDYLQDVKTRRACEKTIELAIECVISIISIIVSEKRLGVPESEDDLIKFVEEKKVISSSVAKKVKEMKGFRNILVHRYGEIDDKLAYNYLKNELNDFTLFEKEINRFLKK
jgi:uncharacterized protein YutE (UPF0331/DUF86 family)